MSRFVTPKTKGAKAQAGRGTKEGVRDYAERVAKYVPAEVIAAYLAIVSITEGTSEAATHGRYAGLMFALAFGLIITPFYLKKLAEPGEPWCKQSAVSIIAFIVWTYSMKGIWMEWWHVYYSGVAGIALIVFSVLSGFYVPEVS